MFKKHLLYLTNEHLQAAIWQGGKIHGWTSFMVDEAGVASFAAYLKRWAKLRTYLLVDLIEEDFRLDAIPHVGSRDRSALLDRKLNQIYRATPYRYAKVQGRDKTGRRDDQVLYTAITNASLLTPWLDVIESQNAPLVGIYSAPLLSPRLLKALNLGAKHVLLVTLHDGDQLRQNYSQSGEIKFSRMTPLNTQAPQQLSTKIREEVRKTWQYLEGLRQLVTGEPLHVCVVANSNDIDAASFSSPLSPDVVFEFVDLARVAKSLGVKAPIENSNSEALLLQLLARSPQGNHFAQPGQTRHASVWLAQQWAIAAGATALLASAALGSANLLEGRLLATSVQHAQDETTRIEAEQRSVRSALPVSSVAPDVMSSTVNFYNQSIRTAPSYSGFLIKLSHVLEQFPKIQLQELHWGLSHDATKLPFTAPETTATPASSVTPESEAANSSYTGALPVLAGQYYQIAILSARIVPFDQDYRAALDELKQFAGALDHNLHAKVIPLVQPLDTSTRVGLQGTATSNQVPSEAPLVIKLIIPPNKP